MKKSLFYWAFLVLAGMSLTACSSGDDNIADNTTPVTPGSQNKTVILTGTIGVGGDETRAVDNDGKTSWTKDDEIAINYQKSSDGNYARTVGTITNVSSDGKYATFTATLTDPKNDGNIGFAYPNDKVSNSTASNAYNFVFSYDAYSTQEGTTATITSSGLDYACTENGGEVKMAVDNGKATLKSTALLKNQFSMYEFTLKTDETTPQNAPATELKIWVGSENFSSPTPTYTITPANSAAYSTFYVALQPTPSTVDNVKIVAYFDGKAAAIKLDDATKVNAITSTDYGKFLCVDETENKTTHEKDHQAYLCATTSSAYFCEHTYSTSKFVKGKLYTKELEVKKLTPTAVIAHVGGINNYCTKFLALALKDVYSGTKSLSDAQAEIGGGWINTNVKLKIAGTTYNQLVGSTAVGTKGKIDAVQDNPKDANSVIRGVETSEGSGVYAIVPSASLTSPAAKGWRIPTVTDFRYIFQSLGIMDANKINATTPAGIVDHDGWYYSGQTTDTGGFIRYGTGNTALVSYINTNLFKESAYNMGNQFYWLSSQVINTAGATQSSKAWRFSFSADQFIWTEGLDQSLARLVFAY